MVKQDIISCWVKIVKASDSGVHKGRHYAKEGRECKQHDNEVSYFEIKREIQNIRGAECHANDDYQSRPEDLKRQDMICLSHYRTQPT